MLELDRIVAFHSLRQEQDLLLNIRSQQQQVHDLQNSCYNENMNQLKWTEPRPYRRETFRQSDNNSFGKSLKFAGISFLILLGVRLIAGMGNANPQIPDWISTIGIACITALFLAFAFPWLIGLFEVSNVFLSAKGINNNIVGHGATLYFWPWDEIAYCRFSEQVIRGIRYPTVSLFDHQDQLLTTFGIPTEAIRDSIQAFFEQNGHPIASQSGNDF